MKIEITKIAEKDIKKLDFVVKERVLRAIYGMREKPFEASIERVKKTKAQVAT